MGSSRKSNSTENGRMRIRRLIAEHPLGRDRGSFVRQALHRFSRENMLSSFKPSSETYERAISGERIPER